jgi:hypothetical protein
MRCFLKSGIEYVIGCAASAGSWAYAKAVGPWWVEWAIIPISFITALGLTAASRHRRDGKDGQTATSKRRLPSWKVSVLIIGSLLAALVAHAYIPLLAFAFWPETTSMLPWLVGILLHLFWTTAFAAIVVLLQKQ